MKLLVTGGLGFIGSNFILKLLRESNDFEIVNVDAELYGADRRNLSEMNRNKLFNYMIQLMETENNMKMLSNLIPFLESYKSKLILYSYDSFLFDFNLDDGVDFLNKTKEIIESNGLFPTKTSKGTNYHEMEDITEKL